MDCARGAVRSRRRSMTTWNCRASWDFVQRRRSPGGGVRRTQTWSNKYLPAERLPRCPAASGSRAVPQPRVSELGKILPAEHHNLLNPRIVDHACPVARRGNGGRGRGVPVLSVPEPHVGAIDETRRTRHSAPEHHDLLPRTVVGHDCRLAAWRDGGRRQRAPVRLRPRDAAQENRPDDYLHT